MNYKVSCSNIQYKRFELIFYLNSFFHFKLNYSFKIEVKVFKKTKIQTN